MDAGLIYAAFLQAYRIDLTETDMHWWKFCALLNALPQDTALSQIIGYRTMDTTGLPQKEKKRLAKIKEKYALEEQAQRMTLTERDATLKAYVAERLSSMGK